MPLRIQPATRGFVAKQVALGARRKQALVALSVALAERKRDRAIGMRLANARHHAAQHVVGKERIFPTLQNEGAKAQVVTRMRAFDNLIGGKAIATRDPIRAANTAVETIVLAAARHLDEPAREHRIAIHKLARRNGTTRKLSGHRRRTPSDEPLVFLQLQGMVVLEHVR